MEFSYHSPPSNVARAVKAVWVARGTQAEFAHSDPIVPDGCVEMVFNFGEVFKEGAHLQPRDLLVGQMMRPTVATPTGEVDLIGLRLWPARAGSLLRTPMWELQDRMVRVSDVIAGADGWIDAAHGRSTTGRLEMLSSQLARYCQRLDLERLRLIEAALARIADRRGEVSIEAIAGDTGISRRQLERRFRDEVGLGAKQVARLARVHGALRMLDNEPRASGVDVALRCGFADQAHLIKECRAIAGITPARLLPGGTNWSSLMRDRV